MRKIAAVLLAGALIGAFVNVAEAGKKAKAGPLWTDEAGDADLDQGIPLDSGGFDLVEGAITKNKDNLEFKVTHSSMPPTGSLPEGFRFLWAFSVGDEVYRLTVKTADIGKPDIPQGQTTERVGRVDAQGHFRLEGNCSTNAVGVSFINCAPLEYLEGAFDPASASFTVIVPLKSIKAKPGALIGPGAGDANAICNTPICWVTHTAERSSGNALIDTAIQSESYKVPKK